MLQNLSTAQDVTGKWSGIMTVELWWDGMTGPPHKRFDITIQDNVVTGTMKGEGKLIIGGQLLGQQNCSGKRTPGNEESGDMSCFMCYTSMYNWSFIPGPNGSLNYYMVPLLPIGKKLCTGSAPTGINTKPWFFGPASRGNCLKQIQLR